MDDARDAKESVADDLRQWFSSEFPEAGTKVRLAYDLGCRMMLKKLNERNCLNETGAAERAKFLLSNSL